MLSVALCIVIYVPTGSTPFLKWIPLLYPSPPRLHGYQAFIKAVEIKLAIDLRDDTFYNQCFHYPTNTRERIMLAVASDVF